MPSCDVRHASRGDRQRLRVAGLAALVLYLSPLPARAEGSTEADRLRLEYGVYFAAVRILSVSADTSFTPPSYRMALDVKTVGLVGTLIPWTWHSESSGLIEQTILTPAAHRSESFYRQQSRKVEVAYRDGGEVEILIDDPPAAADDREEVPADLRAATVDPLTATLSLLHAVSRGNGCDSTQRIFDGRRRYDLVYEDLGSTELAPSRRRSYTGPARLCRSTMRRIAGFKRDSEYSNDQPGPSKVWLACPIDGASAVPVELEMSGSAGTLHMYLSSAQPRAGAEVGERVAPSTAGGHPRRCPIGTDRAPS